MPHCTGSGGNSSVQFGAINVFLPLEMVRWLDKTCVRLCVYRRTRTVSMTIFSMCVRVSNVPHPDLLTHISTESY